VYEEIILGFFLGFFAFIGEDILRRWLDERSVRKRVLKNLISEVRENKRIQDVSTWVSLQKNAWDEAKSTGVVMDLREDLRARLIDLYARITEKNELLVYHRIGISEFQGRGLGISDATGNVVTPLTQIIGDLTTALRTDFDSIVPLLEEALDC